MIQYISIIIIMYLIVHVYVFACVFIHICMLICDDVLYAEADTVGLGVPWAPT